MGITLRLTGTQHQELRNHLMPDDGKEAIALLFCVPALRADGGLLLVKEVRLIPHEECIGDVLLVAQLDRAAVS